MKVTWVLLLALGVVSADIGLGYHYKVPHTSYGAPSYQTGYRSGQFGSSSTGNLGQSTGFQTGTATGFNSFQTSGSSSGAFGSVQPLNTGFQTQYQSSSAFQAAAVNKFNQYYQVQQQPTQVFKHFYIHSAPEEEEEVKPRAPIVLPAPQKHYKIIFVKAPSEVKPPNLIAPIQPQNEEKTIVYVLVKKPDDQPDVVLPKIENKPPSKPEVYFIKYKNKQDSQAVINNIVKDYNEGQAVVLNSGSGENSFQSGGAANVQFQSGVQNGASSGAYTSGGSQTIGLSTGNSGSSIGHSHISSPVTISSTAGYEGILSTSQGVPHESYGIPKFRS